MLLDEQELGVNYIMIVFGGYTGYTVSFLFPSYMRLFCLMLTQYISC